MSFVIKVAINTQMADNVINDPTEKNIKAIINKKNSATINASNFLIVFLILNV